MGTMMARNASGLVALALCAVFASVGALAQVTYSLGDTVPLLDDDYYAGVAKNGVGPAPGRFAMGGQASKDGLKVAFLMFTTDLTETSIAVVNVGDPGS